MNKNHTIIRSSNIYKIYREAHNSILENQYMILIGRLVYSELEGKWRFYKALIGVHGLTEEDTKYITERLRELNKRGLR